MKFWEFILKNKLWFVGTGIAMILSGIALLSQYYLTGIFIIVCGVLLVFLVISASIMKFILIKMKALKKETVKIFLHYLMDKYGGEEIKNIAMDKINRKLIGSPIIFMVSWPWKLTELNMLQLAYLCILRFLKYQGCKVRIYVFLPYKKRKDRAGIKKFKKLIKKVCSFRSYKPIRFIPSDKLRKNLEIVDDYLVECAQQFLDVHFKKCPKNTREELNKFIYEVYTMFTMWMEFKDIKKDRAYILIDRARYQEFYKEMAQIEKYETFIPILTWFKVPTERNKWLFLEETTPVLKNKLDTYSFESFEFLYEIILLNFSFMDKNFSKMVNSFISFEDNKVHIKIGDNKPCVGEYAEFIKVDTKKLSQIYKESKEELVSTTVELWKKISEYLV